MHKAIYNTDSLQQYILVHTQFTAYLYKNPQKMPKIDELFTQITTKYQKLKKTAANSHSNIGIDIDQKQHAKHMIKLAQQLIALCVQAQKMLQYTNPSSQNFRQRTQVVNIRERAMLVIKENQQQISNKQKNKNKGIGNEKKNNLVSSSKNCQEEGVSGEQQLTVTKKISQEEMSRRICLKIVEKDLSSKNHKVSLEQLKNVAAQLQQKQEIATQIKQLIHQQNGDIQLIQQFIDNGLDQTKQANKQLQTAAQIQMRSRLTKIRLGIGGILAAIGYGIIGIPGLIFGGIVGIVKGGSMLRKGSG